MPRAPEIFKNLMKIFFTLINFNKKEKMNIMIIMNDYESSMNVFSFIPTQFLLCFSEGRDLQMGKYLGPMIGYNASLLPYVKFQPIRFLTVFHTSFLVPCFHHCCPPYLEVISRISLSKFSSSSLISYLFYIYPKSHIFFIVIHLTL